MAVFNCANVKLPHMTGREICIHARNGASCQVSCVSTRYTRTPCFADTQPAMQLDLTRILVGSSRSGSHIED